MEATHLDGKHFWEPINNKPLDPWDKLTTALFVSSFKALMNAWEIDDTETAKKELDFLFKITPDAQKWHNYLEVSPDFVRTVVERIRISVNSQQ
tara:strand:- start:48 stop:329 length:282 start_codon:yes stop_codon:yes gene_type:complete